MGLKDVLAKMRIVELDPPVDPAAPPPTRGPAPPPRAGGAAAAAPASGKASAGGSAKAPAAASADMLQEILASIPKDAPKVDKAVLETPKPGAPLADFAAIYRAAAVPEPPHGFSAYKVLEMLASPQLASMEPRARAQALAAFLEMNPAGKVSVRDIIEDALRRDQALDAYERALIERLSARAGEVARVNAQIQAEIDDAVRRGQERLRANEEALGAERERMAEWQRAKHAEEQRLHDAVAPFVEANPVSVGGVAPASGAPPKNP